MEQDNKFIRSLVQSAQSGKVVALEELYKMNINRIYAIALRMIANNPLAALLTQNTLITAWQQLARVRAEVPFADWLKSMAIYNSLNELREKKLQKDKKALKHFSGDAKSAKHSADPVEKAIAELNDDQRIILVLHLIEEYSTTEISDLYGLTKTKTEKLLEEAINKIAAGQDKSNAEIISLVKALPKEIKPHDEIIPAAMEAIREVKIEEFKEAESANGEKEEPPIEEEKIEPVKEKEKVKEKKSEKKKTKGNKKFVWIVISIVLAIVAVLYFTSRSKVWSIENHSGNFSLNSAVNTAVEVTPGDIIKTVVSSSVVISIPDVGKIKLLENTSLKRLDEENTAQLINGNLEITNSGALENFKLEIPKAVIEDFYTGNNYTVNVNEDGESIIKISSGWLEVQTQYDESVFPQGFELKLDDERGMGLPYPSDSDPSYVNQLEEYIFNGKKLNVLTIVLNKSKEEDAVTLWNLLRRVDDMQREQVYAKLAELVPPPKEVKKQEVLDLDSKMLYAWLDKIEWAL